MTGRRRDPGEVSQYGKATGDGRINQVAGDQHIHHHYASACGARIEANTTRASAQAAGRERVRVGIVPRLAECLQIRPVAAQLQELVTGGTAVQCQVLSGMGGVGKTQMAAQHARAVWDAGRVQVLLWVTAASRTAIVDSYADAAMRLGMGGDPGDAERTARRFLEWADTTDQEWMVVLDDVQDPADVTGLWPPDRQAGRVVVTTRRRAAALGEQGRQLLRVDLFTQAEARAYLQGKLAMHGRADDPVQLNALAADLGLLPLALAQAAAFMVDEDLDCATYRRLLADRRMTLPDLLPDALPDGHPAPVAATWSLSIEGADRCRPSGLARPLLQLCAVLDPNGIPAAVLKARPSLEYLADAGARNSASTPYRGEEGEEGKETDVGLPQVERAVRVLHRFNLLTHDPQATHQEIRVHNLIQRATREALDTGEQTRTLHAAADALVAIWPGTERDGLGMILRACAVELRNIAGDRLWLANAHPVLFLLGDSFGNTGRAAAAVSYFGKLVDETNALLGSDHHDTLRARHRHARWTGQNGDSAGARDLLAELLPNRARVSGPEHPDTLFVCSDLARWTGWAGDPVAARDRLTTLLPQYECVYGVTHLFTFTVRLELIYWTGAAGDAAGARDLLAMHVHDIEGIIGTDHPDTLNARHYLAFWTGVAGNAGDAKAQAAEVVDRRRRVLGEEHRDTLRSRRDYARWTGESGDPETACRLLAELIPTYERVCGREHPLVLNARLLLAHNIGRAGDSPGARDMIASQILPIRGIVNGPEHPDTLLSQANYARWIGAAGDVESACQQLGGLVHRFERVRGPDHLDTRAVRAELARWTDGVAPDERVIGGRTMI